MKNTGKIITGFLLGSMVGIITGLMIAPTSGKQARKKLGKKSKKLAKQVAGYVGMEDKMDKLQGAGSKSKNGKEPIEASH